MLTTTWDQISSLASYADRWRRSIVMTIGSRSTFATAFRSPIRSLIGHGISVDHQHSIAINNELSTTKKSE